MNTSTTTGECQTNDTNPHILQTSLDFLRFPLDSSIRIVFTGYFNGFNVEVKSVDESTLLYHMGCFGKGSASRSKPQKQTDPIPAIMRKRQYLKRNYWYKKFAGPNEISEAELFLKEVDQVISKIVSDCEKQKNKNVVDLVSSDDENDESSEAVTDHFNCSAINEKNDIVVVVPNSESEDENYFANLNAKGCVNKIRLEEKLVLSLCEAFFLCYGLGCLQIVSDKNPLDVKECWKLFNDTDNNFISKYVVYHHFRSRGYIVKSGIKFGGDYLLYKEGPGLTHADFIVVIRDDEKQNIFNFRSILGHIRMATTTVKEILIVEVLKPLENSNLLENLSGYKVREILLNRNIPVTINENIN